MIEDTWKNLINNTHYDIAEREQAWEDHRAGRAVTTDVGVPDTLPPKPYEAVSVQIQTIAHRTSLDSLIFPVDTLLTILCEYAVTNQQDESIGADPEWPLVLFLGLGVSHAMVTRVLERIFDAQEAPFTGRRRRTVVRWILAVVEAWKREVERQGLGSVGKGDSGLGVWVVDLLARMDEAMTEMVGQDKASRPGHATATEEVWRRTRALKRAVENVVITAERGSLRFL